MSRNVGSGGNAAVGGNGADCVVEVAVPAVVLNPLDHVELRDLLGGGLLIAVLVIEESGKFHIE